MGNNLVLKRENDLLDDPLPHNFTGIVEFEAQYKTVYYKNGLIHRDNAPAVEYNYNSDDLTIVYYNNGQIHKEDGAACILDPKYYYLDDVYFYYLNDKHYTFEEYWEIQKNTKYASIIMAEKIGNKQEK